MAPSSSRPRALLLAASGLVASGVAAGCQSAPAGPVTEAGDLASGDRTLASGELLDSFPVRVGAGQWLRVDLRSSAFDPYLILRPAAGSPSENDDAVPGDREHAQVIFRATEAGQVEIVATSYEPGESGAYTLVYEVTDTEPQTARSTAGASDEPASPDVTAPPPDEADGETQAEPDAPDAGGVKI